MSTGAVVTTNATSKAQEILEELVVDNTDLFDSDGGDAKSYNSVQRKWILFSRI